MRIPMPHDIYLGLMSGTSLDAIDAVAVSFTPEPSLLGTHSLPLDDETRTAILQLTLPGDNEIDRMGPLDRQLGHLFAQCVNTLIDKHGLDRNRILAIGSHGQTIRHRPGYDHAFTLQISDPNTIAELTGITVVADFRRRDVAAGGQGAPLVPAFHEALFRHTGTDRVILNLGGIANITLLSGTPGLPLRGYDTGPANILMDSWCMRHKGKPYDRGGLWARSGTLQPKLLERLLGHPFFTLPAPKSTGREDFNIQWLDHELNSTPDLPPEDVQATLMELTAISIAAAIRHEGLESAELWVCGGGAYNSALMERMALLLPKMHLQITSAKGLEPNWIEATAFAWLARQTMMNLPGNAHAVTGAKGERILGGIYPG